MKLVKDHFHPSFYKGDSVKSVFEFDLPADQVEFYNASNGSKYRCLLEEHVRRLELKIAESIGTPESALFASVLRDVESMAVELDVKLHRR